MKVLLLALLEGWIDPFSCGTDFYFLALSFGWSSSLSAFILMLFCFKLNKKKDIICWCGLNLLLFVAFEAAGFLSPPAVGDILWDRSSPRSCASVRSTEERVDADADCWLTRGRTGSGEKGWVALVLNQEREPAVDPENVWNEQRDLGRSHLTSDAIHYVFGWPHE